MDILSGSIRNLHEAYMREALKQARVAFDRDEVPVGAVIVHEGTIIARAHNQIITLKDPTAHAEMIAITQAASYLQNERLIDCDIYTTIEPCPMCAGALVLARIRNIFYGAYDPKTGACGSAINIACNNELNHKVNITPGLLGEEASMIMRDFFKGKR